MDPKPYEFVYIGDGFNTKEVIKMHEYLGATWDRKPGWYATIPPKDYLDIIRWCEVNVNCFDYTVGIYFIWLVHKKDVALFLLRWA